MPQLDTTSALITAVASAGISFWLALHLLGKLNKRFDRKSQRVLAMIAMVSFSIGFGGVLNELIGFPLQGLNIRWEKIVTFFIANMLVIPAIFVGIAFAIRSKPIEPPKFELASKTVTSVPTNFRYKHAIYLTLLAGTFFLTYKVYENHHNPVFEKYLGVDTEKCIADFPPTSLVRFFIDKDTRTVLSMAKDLDDGSTHNFIFKNCDIFNSINWKCGGEFVGNGYAIISPKTEMTNGEKVIYNPQFPSNDKCGGTQYRKATFLTSLRF